MSRVLVRQAVPKFTELLSTSVDGTRELQSGLDPIAAAGDVENGLSSTTALSATR